MTSRLILILGQSILLIAILTGCASTKALQQYPERHVDRPYVFNVGVNAWRVIGIYAVSQDSAAPQASKFLVFPWQWEQSVTDRISLNWSPLPTEVKFQMVRNDRYWMGFSLNLLGSPLFLFQEFNWTPIFQLEQRLRISKWTAFTIGLLGQMELRRSATDSLSGAVGLRLGPMYQIIDRIAAEPYLVMLLEMGNPRVGYLPDPPASDPTSPHLRVPMGLRITALAFRQWEGSVDYRYLGLGYPNEYQSHQGTFSVTHFF